MSYTTEREEGEGEIGELHQREREEGEIGELHHREGGGRGRDR